MSLFSSVSVSAFAYDSNGNQFPVTLPRTESFPSRRFSVHLTDSPYPKSWAPAVPLKNKFHLEITLGNRISEGRIGLVYDAYVSRVIDSSTKEEVSSASLGLPENLCVKVAKPEHCRSLAREAWVYEQLPENEGYQGVAVPRCYGFFTTLVNDSIDTSGRPPASIRPWAERDPVRDDEIPKARTDGRLPDWLDDDIRSDCYGDDADTSKLASPWNVWQHNLDSPLISLTIMERLGECFPPGKKVVEERADLQGVLDDIGTASILHRDIRYSNAVRAPPNPNSRICPRHGYRHEWRLVDFDRSVKTDVLHEDFDRSHLQSSYRASLRLASFRGYIYS